MLSSRALTSHGHERTISTRCANIAETSDHGLIAVSLFNGYYSKARLSDLISWATTRFSQFHVPIYDAPHAYTLAASGVSPRKAVQKAREEGRKLNRRISSLSNSLPCKIRPPAILSWDALSTNTRYLELMIEVERAFCLDRRFRNDCFAMTDQVKSVATEPTARQEADRIVSVRYLLSEMPLLMDTAAIVGSKSSVFCYHRSYDFYERFFNNEYTIGPADNQALLIVTFDEQQAAEN